MAIEFNCHLCGRLVKAPDELAGKKARCPQCQQVIDVPEPVYDAEEIPAAPLAEAPPPMMPPAAEPPPFGFDQPTMPAGGDVEGRRPCPMCGEMIQASALKCRFCGEAFDPILRKKAVNKGDLDMTTGDWFVALLCSGIGCIVGIVWMIQGKPKGTKMFGVSFMMVVVWNVLRAMIELGGRR